MPRQTGTTPASGHSYDFEQESRRETPDAAVIVMLTAWSSEKQLVNGVYGYSVQDQSFI
jgi:hypothetical protein